MPYIGNQAVVGDSANTFKSLDDIVSFTVTFNATDSSVVSIANNTLTFSNHRFVTGQKVTYNDGGGTAIGGLSDGSYFIIKEDQSTIKLASSASNAAAGTAIDLTSGAAGTSHTLNIAQDGVNTKFKATHSNGTKAKISRPAQITLSINGVIQQPTADYTIESDSTIVFSQAPIATDKIFASFIGEVATSFDIADNTVDEFTANGSTTSFTLSKELPANNDALVTLDGVVQYPDTQTTTRAYSTTDNTITFTSAPAAGVIIQVRHIGFSGASSQSVTGFYGRTGNVSLKNTDNVDVNNLTAAGTVTVTGDLNVSGDLTYDETVSRNLNVTGVATVASGLVSTGDWKIGTATTLSQDNIFTTGIITATKLHLDNSSGSGISFLNDESKIQTGSSGNMLGIQGGATNMGGRIELRGGNDTGDIRMFAQGATSTQVERLRIEKAGNVNIVNNLKVAGVTTATTFSGSGASLTNLPSAQLTGALPALDGSALTGVGGTDFIHAEQISNSGITTSKAFKPTDQNLSHRNLIINGNMRVAQRGDSSTSSGMHTVDRWTVNWSGGGVTQAKTLLTSGSPFNEGHANYLRLTNTGNTTTDTDYRFIGQSIEAQDLLNSGWHYKNSSANITVSFWVRSSLAGTYNLWLSTRDGSPTYYYSHPFTLVANTWTKIEKQIPGFDSISIDNNNGDGLLIHVVPWYGTYYTTSGHTNNSWITASSTDRVTDYAQNWANTSNATFDLTGVQMEVGDVATPFEHRPIGDELMKCYRYYYRQTVDNNKVYGGGMSDNDGTNIYIFIKFPTEMCYAPTAVEQNGTAGHYKVRRDTTKSCSGVPTFVDATKYAGRVNFPSSGHGWGTGQFLWGLGGNASSYIAFSAEI